MSDFEHFAFNMTAKPENHHTRDVAMAAFTLVAALFQLLRDEGVITWDQGYTLPVAAAEEAPTTEAGQLILSVN